MNMCAQGFRSSMKQVIIRSPEKAKVLVVVDIAAKTANLVGLSCYLIPKPQCTGS
jgi:hypothetical protein